LPQHTDYGRKSSINVYLKCNNEETQFYQLSNLETVFESFKAQQNDVWIMDAATPHSIIVNKNSSREFLSFSFKNLKYKELEKFFNEY